MAAEADQLTQLSAFTKIVADTGEIDSIAKYKPLDATTNPSLLSAAAQMKEYQHLVDDAINYGKGQGKNEAEVLDIIMDKLAVNFGAEILKLIPGVVSTEVDARLSFNTQATLDKARRLIALYKEIGVDKERVLIKIASTWEGIRAAEVLEKEGIHCNMTLLFAMPQAVACAHAGVTLISPFVGRITDWFKKSTGTKDYLPQEDPGVQSVAAIYKYYKTFGHKTIVMGASFRNIGQILSLAGCDKLTISPKLLEELRSSHNVVERVLIAEQKDDSIKELRYDESAFRFEMNESAMATEKLAEGIRLFAEASQKLEKYITEKLKHSWFRRSWQVWFNM